MNLRTWLKINGVTIKEFAAWIDHSHTYISACMTGGHKPGRKLKQAIYIKTNKEVGPDDWSDPPFSEIKVKKSSLTRKIKENFKQLKIQAEEEKAKNKNKKKK